MSELTFADLGLAEPLLRAVADTGYTTPTPIQAQAIPQVLQGDRKSTRLNSSHLKLSRMPSSA